MVVLESNDDRIKENYVLRNIPKIFYFVKYWCKVMFEVKRYLCLNVSAVNANVTTVWAKNSKISFHRFHFYTTVEPVFMIVMANKNEYLKNLRLL